MGSCTTTTLAYKIGSKYAPFVSRPFDQIRLWIWIWNRVRGDFKAIVEAKQSWRKAYGDISAPAATQVMDRVGFCRKHTNLKVSWSKAKGPLTASLATIIEIGYIPLSTTHWKVCKTEDGTH